MSNFAADCFAELVSESSRVAASTIHHFEYKIHHFEYKIRHFEYKIHHSEYKIRHL